MIGRKKSDVVDINYKKPKLSLFEKFKLCNKILVQLKTYLFDLYIPELFAN